MLFKIKCILSKTVLCNAYILATSKGQTVEEGEGCRGKGGEGTESKDSYFLINMHFMASENGS